MSNITRILMAAAGVDTYVYEGIDPPNPQPDTPYEMWSWGKNARGQQGQGDTTSRSSPVRIGSDSWVAVGNGSPYGHAMAQKVGGTAWGWGRGNKGTAGLSADNSSPVQIGTTSNWSTLEPGFEHSVGLKKNGEIWTIGSHLQGQLGDGSATSSTGRSSFVQVGTERTWVQAVAGRKCTFARKNDGTLWGWGGNNYGQLATGDTADRSSPVQIGTNSNWSHVSAGAGAYLMVTTAGTLWSIGQGWYGVLGHGNTNNLSSPTQIGALTDWVSTVGSTCRTSVKANGTLWCWGHNSQGQVGDGSVTTRTSPVQIGALTDWTNNASASYYSNAVIKTDGTLWCWGGGSNGSNGDGTTTNRSSPVKIGTLTTWTDVLRLKHAAIALKS